MPSGDHKIAIEAMVDFSHLSLAERVAFLSSPINTFGLLDKIIDGFADLDNKYNEMLIGAAIPFHGITKSAGFLEFIEPDLSDVSKLANTYANTISDLEPEDLFDDRDELQNMFRNVAGALDAVSECLRTLVDQMRVVQNVMMENLEDEVRDNFNEALAFWIRSVSVNETPEQPVLFKSEELDAALEAWSKKE